MRNCPRAPPQATRRALKRVMPPPPPPTTVSYAKKPQLPITLVKKPLILSSSVKKPLILSSSVKKPLLLASSSIKPQLATSSSKAPELATSSSKRPRLPASFKQPLPLEPNVNKTFRTFSFKEDLPDPLSSPRFLSPDVIPPIIVDESARKRYVVGGFLGEGSFSRVYIVRTDGATKIACKVVQKSKLIRKESLKARLDSEIAVHSSIQHKYIVPFIASCEDATNVYVMTELCSRNTLAEFIQSRGFLSPTESRYFFRQIAITVEYLHSQLIIHRDIKPNNIFLTNDLKVQLGDFGLAIKVREPTDELMAFCGSPNYMAPEIVANRRKGGKYTTSHSFPCDIWSLGCVLYRMIYGDAPFDDETLDQVFENIKVRNIVFPRAYTSRFVAARRLIESMLQLDPKKRPRAGKVVDSDFLREAFIPESLPIPEPPKTNGAEKPTSSGVIQPTPKQKAEEGVFKKPAAPPPPPRPKASPSLAIANKTIKVEEEESKEPAKEKLTPPKKVVSSPPKHFKIKRGGPSSVPRRPAIVGNPNLSRSQASVFKALSVVRRSARLRKIPEGAMPFNVGGPSSVPRRPAIVGNPNLSRSQASVFKALSVVRRSARLRKIPEGVMSFFVALKKPRSRRSRKTPNSNKK